MSEKRFICGLGFPINSDDPLRIISDSVENKDYYKFSDICNVLNKQQALINALKKENKELKEDLKKGFDVPIPYVENSMRRLRAEHKVDEQQATIQFLQDKIDELKKDIDIYEYEEKKHSETVRKLYEENEQLRKELKELENNYKDLLYDGGFDE